MTLIAVGHDHRLRNAKDAEAFLCALSRFPMFRDRRVSLRGCHTSDATKIERLVEAIEPERDHTISFTGAELTPAAQNALERLATSKFHYFDISTSAANLRIWPALYSWVHASLDRADASRAIGTQLEIGDNVVGDAKVKIRDDGKGWPFDVDTKNIATALAMFRAVGGTQVKAGFVNGVAEETKPALIEFLQALGAKVDVVLDVDVSVARSLTELFEGEPLDWQSNGLFVDFPEGRIHGFLVTPNIQERHRLKFLGRITRALRRANLLP